jgi:hypothetical protein
MMSEIVQKYIMFSKLLDALNICINLPFIVQFTINKGNNKINELRAIL